MNVNTSDRRFWVLMAVAVILVGLVLDRMGYLPLVRGLSQTITSPLQLALTRISSQTQDTLTGYGDLETLRNENEELKALADSLMVENVRLKEFEVENEELRQLLNFTRNNPWYDYKAAAVRGRVIGSDPTQLLYYIYIDVGAKEGIAEDMPVVTDRGLVGRVTAVGPKSSQVLLLIDPSSAVNAIIQNSRATGIVYGDISGELIMEEIPQGETVNVGDIVLTSGLGGNFPDKLVIGQVTEVTQRDIDVFQSARIRPTVNFRNLEIVLVVTSFEPIDFEREIWLMEGER